MKKLKTPKKVIDADYYENYEYSGSLNRYQVYPKLFISEGALHVFKKFKCFWISDVIYSYYNKLVIEPFHVLMVYLTDDNACTVYFDDGNYNTVIKQDIPFTDLSTNVKLYISLEEDKLIVYLPSEY